MREHIELRVLRSILKQSNLSSIQVDDKFFRQFDNLESKLKAASTTEEFSQLYLIISLLKKWKGWKSDIDPQEASLAAWKRAEEKCFDTNRRLNALDNPITSSPIDRLIRQTRKEMVKIMGAAPPNWWKSKCDWPTGATFDTKMATLVHEKVQERVTSSTSAARHMYGIYELGWNFTKKNRVEFVPKTYKVHRPIACEPTVNAFLQKGVGRTLRSLLKTRGGVDLDMQATLNREASFLARSCELSTIDLESASDTLSLSLLRLICPPEWFSLLDSLRSAFSRYTDSDGIVKVRYLDKFSSMGNGYTFELETIVFLSICRACYKLMGIEESNTLCVFGDDIICDRRCFDLIEKALVFFGFILNREKTFKEGDFFESCGRHFHCEVDVTPCYQKDVCKSIDKLIIFHNKLFRWAQRTGQRHIVRESLTLILKECSKYFRDGVLPFMPSFLEGDEALLTEQQRGWHYDKHGDIIIDISLCRKTVKASLLEQSFYLRNWLRCGNSFYSDFSGHLQDDAGAFYVVRRKAKRWRSCYQTH